MILYDFLLSYESSILSLHYFIPSLFLRAYDFLFLEAESKRT